MAVDLGKSISQVAGAIYDPLNISGYGGVPGVNSNGRTLTDLGDDVSGRTNDKRAIDAQTAGAGAANTTLQPYSTIGMTGLFGLQNKDLVGDFQGDPGYQFRLNEGNKAINSAAAARGMGNSGATMKALTRYGQDYASNEYNNAYNREFGRLSTLAGIGGNAAAGIAGNQIGLANAQAGQSIAANNRQANLQGQFIGGGATILASDERLKTDITPISKEDLSEMKSFLKAFHFKYKDELRGVGQWPGIMAQDLEKSKLGRTLVIEDEQGFKCIDLKKLMSMFLATMAEA